MSAMEENLKSAQACTSGRAAYSAQLFRSYGSKDVRPEQVTLGTKAANWNQAIQPVQNVLRLLPGHLRSKVVAMSLHRLCLNPRHENDPGQSSLPYRLERVGAFVLASANAIRWEVEVPLQPYNPAKGVGYLKSVYPGAKVLEPAVFLPITDHERRENPAHWAVEILAPDKSVMAYVALRGLEQVIDPQQLDL
jgi:hypothetical protein